ncbi:vWA domain-containing protein [Actinacidiphila glaucinigra]|uniref:vWA domain-containing protein n=1 Tax=Actinacidiphila glaucinigra TaxID=235986 RepID=UPI002E36E0FC|nr:vWA domain-containing protein [Actinacidiphila glaucinigra]
MTDVQINIDRDEVHLGDEFAVVLAPDELDRRDHGPAGGVAYVLAVDASGSMWEQAIAGATKGPTRWDIAALGTRALLRGLPDAAVVDVLTFATSAVAVANGTAAELRAWAEDPKWLFPNQGGTDIEAALRLAYQRLDSRQGHASRRVILISDGEPNRGLCDAAGLAELTAEASRRAIHTDAIGIGAGANFGLLSGLTVTGITEHVSSREAAEDAMANVIRRLSALSQDVVASSGELEVEVSPHFPVLGVYQLEPLKRIMRSCVADGGGRGPSRVVLPLGAVGAGETGQPVFALRLRGPGRVSQGPLPLLRATGHLEIGADSRELQPSVAEIRTVAGSPFVRQRRPLLQIRAIELESQVNERIRTAPAHEHPEIYREAARLARDIPNAELAAEFDRSVSGLDSGLDANDVHNELRASSSRGSKDERHWFKKIPEVTPTTRAPRRPVEDLDDDSDDDFPHGYGERRAGAAHGTTFAELPTADGPERRPPGAVAPPRPAEYSPTTPDPDGSTRPRGHRP